MPLGLPHSVFLEWEPEDRSKALAWKLEDATRCSMCGTADWEWEEDRFAYEPQQRLCHGCYLKDIVTETEERRPGVSVVLIPAESITEEMREQIAQWQGMA